MLGIKLLSASKILTQSAFGLPAPNAGLFAYFNQMFLDLGGSIHEHRNPVTQACIEALFDRVMNPPMLDVEQPMMEDVDAAERHLIGMIEEEEEAKIRKPLGRPRPPIPTIV